MALGGPDIYPGHPGWDQRGDLRELEYKQSRAYGKGYEDARKQVKLLLDSTREMSLTAQLLAIIAWAGSDLKEIQDLLTGRNDDQT